MYIHFDIDILFFFRLVYSSRMQCSILIINNLVNYRLYLFNLFTTRLYFLMMQQKFTSISFIKELLKRKQHVINNLSKVLLNNF